MGWSGWVWRRENLVFTLEFEPWAIQAVASRYTSYASLAILEKKNKMLNTRSRYTEGVQTDDETHSVSYLICAEGSSTKLNLLAPEFGI